MSSHFTCPRNTITDSYPKSKYENSNKYRREEIIETLKLRFVEKHNHNLPIFGIEKPNLNDFTTTEKDMKRGVSRFPPSQMRIKSEDLISESAGGSGGPKGSEAEVTDSTFAVLDELQQNVEIRNKQFQESKNFQDKGEDDDDDDDDEDEENKYSGGPNPGARASMRQGGAMIFTRNQADKLVIKLEDFVIMKMVGKGTFGKVFLVQHMITKKIYAMKCIRKDIVIDNEQFENIKLEKDILYTIEHFLRYGSVFH